MSAAANPRYAGVKVVLGVPSEIKPIIGAPDGKIRLRLRRRRVAELFVKTPDGIRQFLLADQGHHWAPVFEQGRNHRPPPAT